MIASGQTISDNIYYWTITLTISFFTLNKLDLTENIICDHIKLIMITLHITLIYWMITVTITLIYWRITLTISTFPLNKLDLTENIFCDHIKLRMRDLYKRFVKTWIRFVNPWIRTVSWPQILTPKRFDSYPTIQILRILDSYSIVDHESWL